MAKQPKATKAAETGIPGLAIGRIVHYVLANGPHAGTHRPAMIVHVHGGDGDVALHVFLHVGTDFPPDEHPGGVWFRSRVPYDQEHKAQGTWHFPEEAPPKPAPPMPPAEGGGAP